VPDYCRATYDRRLLVGETRESVLKPLLELIRNCKERDPKFDARVSFASGVERCYTGDEIRGERFFPGWVFDQDDAFVQTALAGLRSAGLDPEITQYSFCTNGSHYAGEAGIRTIGFGPSREDLAHTIDEYIEVDQLIKATEGYRESCSRIPGKVDGSMKTLIKNGWIVDGTGRPRFAATWCSRMN